MRETSFDQYVDRTGTNSVKWDYRGQVFGREDILPMWVADSDWPTSDYVIEAIVDRAKHGVFGYTKPDRETDRLVVDWWKRRYDWELDPDWLVYANGVVPTLSIAVDTFVRPGEGVILQPPVYYPFFTSVERGGSQTVENELILDEDGYRMDYEDLAAVCDRPRGKKPVEPTPTLMVLCNPHNPVGRVWTEGELERLSDICLENDVLIVSDDIHSEFIYSGNKYRPLASLSPEIARNTITLASPSKAFNTAGLPASIAIIPNDRLRRRIEIALDKLIKGPSVFGLEALMAAYGEGESWLEDQLTYLQENMEYSYRFLDREVAGVEPLKPEGTILLWVDCRPLGLTTEELEDLIVNEAKVGLDFGHWFGPGGEGFVRLNFACPRGILEEGLSRIEKAVGSLG